MSTGAKTTKRSSSVAIATPLSSSEFVQLKNVFLLPPWVSISRNKLTTNFPSLSTWQDFFHFFFIYADGSKKCDKDKTFFRISEVKRKDKVLLHMWCVKIFKALISPSNVPITVIIRRFVANWIRYWFLLMRMKYIYMQICQSVKKVNIWIFFKVYYVLETITINKLHFAVMCLIKRL